MGVQLGREQELEAPPPRVSHVVWADNIYFLGHSSEQVPCMAQDFTDLLVRFKLRWKPTSLQLMATEPRKHLQREAGWVA